MKFFDPYKINDPTMPDLPALTPSRTSGGRFNGYSMLGNLSNDHLPLDSRGWRSYALGAYYRLGRAVPKDAAWIKLCNDIIPENVIDEFSWRMICEMVEVAADQAEKTPTDNKAIIEAAHAYLISKQNELARSHLEAILGNDGDPKAFEALDIEEVLVKYLGEHPYNNKRVPGRSCPKCGFPLIINESKHKTIDPDIPRYERRIVCSAFSSSGCNYKEPWTEKIRALLDSPVMVDVDF